MDDCNITPLGCHLEWGRRGAERAALRGDILAVCDVLSFSTAVVTACMRGARVYPCVNDTEARQCVARYGAVSRELSGANVPGGVEPIAAFSRGD